MLCGEDQPDTAQPIREMLKDKISAFTGNTGGGKIHFAEPAVSSVSAGYRGDQQKIRPRPAHHSAGDAVRSPGKEVTPQILLAFPPWIFLRYVPIRKEELADCFREFAPYVNDCKFTGCSHTVEKGCAVLAALEAGEIAPPPGMKSYCELYRQAQQIKDWQWKEEGKTDETGSASGRQAPFPIRNS